MLLVGRSLNQAGRSFYGTKNPTPPTTTKQKLGVEKHLRERKRVSGQSGSIQGEIDLQVMERALLRFASSL